MIVLHSWFKMVSFVSFSSSFLLIFSFSSLRRWYSASDLLSFSFTAWSFASSSCFHNEPTSFVFSVSLNNWSIWASSSRCWLSGTCSSLSRSIGESWSEELESWSWSSSEVLSDGLKTYNFIYRIDAHFLSQSTLPSIHKDPWFGVGNWTDYNVAHGD